MNKVTPILILIVIAIIAVIIEWLSSLTAGELFGLGLLLAIITTVVVVMKSKNKGKRAQTPPVPIRIEESTTVRHVEDLRPVPGFPGDRLSAFIGKKSKIVVFVDLETNGLSPSNSVLSCSAIKCQVDPATNTLTQLDRFDRYYYPKERINPRAVAVNGLTRNEINKLRGFEDYPKHFVDDRALQEFCEPARRIVAHNSSFDLSFMPFFKGQSFCTMRHNTNVVCAEWMPWKGEYKWPTLLETARHYGIPVDENTLHKSNADVDITFQIFQKMLVRLGPSKR